MSNQFQLSGAQPQKSTRFAPIYTGRFYSGIWTNRSPLRDANTTRISEKYSGASGDALIDGSNIEITNRLTLARRPGNSQFDVNNTYSAVDNFDEFRMFGPNIERINVMIDEANALYSYYGGTKSLVWNKSTGAGQTFMQSVGNSLYFGNGQDNKKWLQSLTTWSADAQWNGPTTPFMNTFLVDPNGNIQQLTGCIVPIVSIQIASNVLTVTADQDISSVLQIGLEVTFPSGMAASFLDNETVTITSVSGSTYTAAFTHANYGPTSETSKHVTVVSGGKPISGSVEPTWSTTPLTPGMVTPSLAVTTDNLAQWTNRGSTVENWGIEPPTTSFTPTIGSSRSAWRAATFFSYAGVIIDSNGNLQQVTTEGKSGNSAPTWATSVSGTTTDGTVVWTMIQTAASLVWAAHHTYTAGQFVIGNAAGTNCLFQLAAITTPHINGALAADCWTGLGVDQFNKFYPAPAPDFTLVPPSLDWESLSGTGGPVSMAQLNGAGEITGQTSTGHTTHWQAAITGSITVPVAGQYSFSINHDDGCIWAIGGGAQKISGTFTDTLGHTQTAKLGLNQLCGVNAKSNDTSVWNFPTAGNYPFEIDWANNANVGNMIFKINGQQLCPAPDESGATQPVWPAWSTAYAPNYPSVKEAANQYQWNNLGPVTDFVWSANIDFTLANTTIIDPNGNTQAPYRTGVTGSTEPTFSTGTNQLTLDNPNLIWICQGAAVAPPPGTISTFNGGWQYTIALVNTLDDTVSNCGPLTAATGNFVGAAGVTIAAGAGLPDPSLIDPQADYVAIFRTTDGEGVPFLIAGSGQSIYTVSLAEYLANGYVDTTPDTELDNLLQGPIAGECTVPPAGAVNLTYHLNRIWFSVGNVVYWTAGPDAPIGNGVNGVPPLNFDSFPSLVKRIVPLSVGAIIFTVSDIYLITGQGTASSPIQGGQPYLRGVGLLSYNALDINGSIIGLFTTDNQFIIFDPNSGVSYSGFPIGDKLRKNNGQPGTSWDAANVYVTWHVDGEDAAWYVSDGQFGWYRLMPTPAPETGVTWSPFASIVGGCKAVKSIEVSPGVHKLLVGPTGTGRILKRDLSSFLDNGVAYSANGVLGSIVLATPGQLAQVSFVSTDSVRIGTPVSLSVIMDEALPYYTGLFENLRVWASDPPNQPKSKSILGQRFYFAELDDQAAVCRHLQLKVSWLPEDAQNELLGFTIFGGYLQEN